MQGCVAAPVVGDEHCPHNGALNEAAEQLRAAVRHDGEPNPPGIATTLPLVELGARLALANLHSAGDKNLIVDATAFAARPAASPGFIDFNVLAGPAADPVLIRAHHPRAELVEDLERRLVARQAKLSPKLHGRHAGCLAGHQIGRPKPYAQRRVQARHDRSHRQSGVTAALAAAQDARTICEAERLSRRLTMGANKPVAPASLLQVGGAGRVVGKKSLELWERLWEPKIATLVNVHEHGRTLPLVAVGDNRMGKEQTLPIRLLPTPPTCRMLPGSGVKLCVGRCGDVARDAEQGTEGVERIEPPVEAEGEFVEVGLQVLVTDPVMDAVQPRFQVCEDEMDDWQILLGDLRIAPFSDGEVFVAALGKAGVAAPVVGDERRARHNGALNEAAEQLRAAVRHDGEPNPPGIATTLPLVELGARLALANLHSVGDKNLIVDATAFAARPAASPGFIDFDVLAGPAADPVLIRAHHPRAELVEDLERRLVARQAKLSPKLHGRHAGCLAGHQIGRPKPYAQRRVRARHDRSHRQSGVTAALAAAQDARTICEAERLSRRLTMGANKPVAPASLLQVGGAGRVVGKKSLELWERLWEPKIATLVNVHEHGRTLPLVAVGDNRIGKEQTITSTTRTWRVDRNAAKKLPQTKSQTKSIF